MTQPDVADAPLTLALCGGLQIQIGGHDVVGRLPGRQGRALVAYLVLNRDRAVSRDELHDVLWPEDAPSAPEAALSSVLAKVRQTLGPGVINGRGALTLDLGPASQLDVQAAGDEVRRAEDALANEDPASALRSANTVRAILGQPLLPDLAGDWIEPWRRHLDALSLRALELAAQAALAIGGSRLPAAERDGAELVRREPFKEGGYELLMRAQVAQGNAAEALLTFDQVRVLLRDELGATPSQSLVALHDRLLRDDAPPAAAPAGRLLPLAACQGSDGAFVGREEFSQRLRLRWQESQAGPTGLVLVVGEAGVGKTRLCTEFAGECHRDGAIVLYGRADEETLLPRQPFVEALRQLLAHEQDALAGIAQQDREILWRLVPDLAPSSNAGAAGADDQTMHYRLSEVVCSLLRAAGGRAPLLLILDDLHWADRPTLLLLRHLLRHPEPTSILVIGTFRDVEVDADHPLRTLLADLRRERRYDRLTLTGLDDAATELLVADRLQNAVSVEFVARLREQTKGNAFFIEETVRCLIDSGLDAAETVTEGALARLGVPEGVAEVVGRRVGRLSDLAAEVLTAGAVVGRDFRLEVVAQVVGRPGDEVVCVLDECLKAGLIVEVSACIDVFAFSHALVREVLYDALSASRRVRLHHRVATALEAIAQIEDVNPVELAHHYLLARHLTGPEPARRYAIAAAERSTRLFAYDEAAEHYRQAFALFESDDEPARCEVLLALGRAQRRAGSREARRSFELAAESAIARGDADQLARAALGHSARYHETGFASARRGQELLETALAALGKDDSARRALLLSRLSENLGFSPDQRDRAAGLSAVGLAMARRLGDEDVLLTALMGRHATLSHIEHLDERLAIGEEFMGMRSARRDLLAERHHWRINDLLECGRVEAAMAEQPQLDALAKHMRQPQWDSIAAGWRGVWAELRGDVALAERCGEECLEHGRRADMKHALSTWVARLLMLRRRQGRVGELAEAAEQLAAGADPRKTGLRTVFGLVLAETGGEPAARAIYREELASYDAVLPPFWLANMAALSELCVALQDAGGARTLYATLAPLGHRNIVVTYASCWGPVDGCLALLARTYGDDELRRLHAQRAVAATQAMDAPLLTAELRACHADCFGARPT